MSSDRLRARGIRRVLWIAFVGNLAVSVAKLWVGWRADLLAVLADGLHSFADAGGSLMALISMAWASRPEDHNHHYGHHKYETLAALGLGGFIGLSAWEILRGAWQRLSDPREASLHELAILVMVATMAFNLALTIYERRMSRRYGSQILAADAAHTSSDFLVSLVVLAGLFAMRSGQHWIDPLVSIFVAIYLAWVALGIVRENVLELSDAAFIEPDAIREVARHVPGVIGCHRIRTRGRQGAAFVDLHIQIAPETDTVTSHRIVHAVEDRIKESIEGVRDVLIHTEPFPDDSPYEG